MQDENEKKDSKQQKGRGDKWKMLKSKNCHEKHLFFRAMVMIP